MPRNDKQLNQGKEIEFADGEVRLIKPLTIRQLRRFVKAVEGINMESTTIDDAQIDAMVAAAAVALDRSYPELAADNEKLEDALDLKCFNELLSVAMGADPNE